MIPALILAAVASAQALPERFTVLLPVSDSLTYSGTVYGPQNGLYAVQWTQSDTDTVFVDSMEPFDLAPIDQTGASAWYLQAWYLPNGVCSPFGCERTYAWDCPAWATPAQVVVNCRVQP
jgi:hypothetical protein